MTSKTSFSNLDQGYLMIRVPLCLHTIKPCSTSEKRFRNASKNLASNMEFNGEERTSKSVRRRISWYSYSCLQVLDQLILLFLRGKKVRGVLQLSYERQRSRQNEPGTYRRAVSREFSSSLWASVTGAWHGIQDDDQFLLSLHVEGTEALLSWSFMCHSANSS
jgi:hypothetical protein